MDKKQGTNVENKGRKEIPIFFAVDDGYIPFLAVSIQSLVDNSSKENNYVIKILYTNISKENRDKISKYEKENVNIEFVDLNEYVEEIKEKLFTRDYYSKTTYYRLFIPTLYPQYNKILYLDSDIVLLSDVADLYNEDLGDNLVGGAPDDVIQTIEVFRNYAEKVVGVADYKNYFNAGILLMNLDQLRKFNFQEKLIYSLGQIKFSVAQDQDYLNRLCKGRVKIINKAWNRMPVAVAQGEPEAKGENLKLIHYNLAFKPWHFEDIPYQEHFWNYANKTEYKDVILGIKANYTEEDKFKGEESDRKLRELAQYECDCVGDDRRNRR
ncbi:MAG: glycosyltransferase family 8 protein [Clostridia bacterium]|nr:glycosyltransferase family 8 protein [Clostridia bacterium]